MRIIILALTLFLTNNVHAADNSFNNLASGSPGKSCLQYSVGGSIQGNNETFLDVADGMAGQPASASHTFATSSSGAGTQTIEHISNNFDDAAVAGKITATTSLSVTTVSAGQNLTPNTYTLAGTVNEALDFEDFYEYKETVKCTITQ
jgi:hypothetical protein